MVSEYKVKQNQVSHIIVYQSSLKKLQDKEGQLQSKLWAFKFFYILEPINIEVISHGICLLIESIPVMEMDSPTTSAYPQTCPMLDFGV